MTAAALKSHALQHHLLWCTEPGWTCWDHSTHYLERNKYHTHLLQEHGNQEQEWTVEAQEWYLMLMVDYTLEIVRIMQQSIQEEQTSVNPTSD